MGYMHSTFGAPAKFVFTQATKVNEDDEDEDDADSEDETADGDRYSIRFNVHQEWEPALYAVCFPAHTTGLDNGNTIEYVVGQKVHPPPAPR